MPDYHVFSSSNLTDWEDHGVIVSNLQSTLGTGRQLYDVGSDREKDGKYYFYFPCCSEREEKGFGIGVAVADQPLKAPFMPMWKPIEGVHGIDPCVLIDKDGQAYIYWAGAGLHMAKPKPNMTELAS